MVTPPFNPSTGKVLQTDDCSLEEFRQLVHFRLFLLSVLQGGFIHVCLFGILIYAICLMLEIN